MGVCKRALYPAAVRVVKMLYRVRRDLRGIRTRAFAWGQGWSPDPVVLSWILDIISR